MKILIVGDLHGNWGKLNSLMQKKLPDIVLQCGDFGWWPQLASKPVLYGQQKEWKLKGLKPPGGCSVYWCDGNHENHWDLLDISMGSVDTSEVNLYKAVFYKPRGTVLTLADGRNVLFMGGADSVDKKMRTIGIDWYPEELISEGDLRRALSHDCKIDIVISHTCPKEFGPRESLVKVNDPSRLALSLILEKYKPDLWYFGHWHCESEGAHDNTLWQALDYPGHGGKWWTWLK